MFVCSTQELVVFIIVFFGFSFRIGCLVWKHDRYGLLLCALMALVPGVSRISLLVVLIIFATSKSAGRSFRFDAGCSLD